MASVEGRDYLVDHYAVLQVAHDATQEDIRAAFVERQRWYHPDRLAGLAPEFIETGERKARAINVAYRILSNRASRLAYDEKLQNWGDRPLSKDGEPVGGSRLRLQDMQSREQADAVLAEIEYGLKQSSRIRSSDDRRVDRFRRAYEADPEDEDAREDYLRALSDAEFSAAIEEGIRLAFLDIRMEELPEGTTHLAALEGRLKESRAGFDSAMSSLGLEAAQRTAITAGETNTNDSAGAALEAFTALRAELTDIFAQQEARVLELAQRRHELTKERLATDRLTYEFPDDPRQSRLAVHFEGLRVEFWMSFAITVDPDGGVDVTSDATADGLMGKPLTDELAQAMREQGISVARMALGESLDPFEHLEAVVTKHTREWLDRQSQTDELVGGEADQQSPTDEMRDAQSHGDARPTTSNESATRGDGGGGDAQLPGTIPDAPHIFVPDRLTAGAPHLRAAARARSVAGRVGAL